MTEDELGQKMLEFERSQTKIIRTTGNELLIGKPLRPTCAFTPILRALEKHGPMTSRDLARLLKKNSHNVCGTVRHAVTAGLVDQTPHSIPRDEDDKTNGHMDCWLYHIAA